MNICRQGKSVQETLEKVLRNKCKCMSFENLAKIGAFIINYQVFIVWCILFFVAQPTKLAS